jgi:hypothetical protein
MVTFWLTTRESTFGTESQPTLVPDVHDVQTVFFLQYSILPSVLNSVGHLVPSSLPNTKESLVYPVLKGHLVSVVTWLGTKGICHLRRSSLPLFYYFASLFCFLFFFNLSNHIWSHNQNHNLTRITIICYLHASGKNRINTFDLTISHTHNTSHNWENSLYAIEKYNTCALCHWKLEFELYAIGCIFWCALCHFLQYSMCECSCLSKY